jgi:thymidylate synthase (FAD)
MEAGYVDHMGTDLSVANAARVSFANASDWDWIDYGEKKLRLLKEKDQNLIRYLARGTSTKEWSGIIQQLSDSTDAEWIEDKVKDLMGMATHWTPFTHTAISLRMKAPVPIRTQCFKHKSGFTENEESRRYISSRPELYIPSEFRSKPDGSIKQGSGEKHIDSDAWLEIYTGMCETCIDTYQLMVESGIAPEQARFILPQGVQVNWIWTGNLASYARFYNQRTDSHAQKEVQDLAEEVGKIISPLFPVSWKALTQ